jgi:hypothetical protein
MQTCAFVLTNPTGTHYWAEHDRFVPAADWAREAAAIHGFGTWAEAFAAAARQVKRGRRLCVAAAPGQPFARVRRFVLTDQARCHYWLGDGFRPVAQWARLPREIVAFDCRAGAEAEALLQRGRGQYLQVAPAPWAGGAGLRPTHRPHA